MGEIRFVGTGETRGYPYLVCKKFLSSLQQNWLPFLTCFTPSTSKKKEVSYPVHVTGLVFHCSYRGEHL